MTLHDEYARATPFEIAFPEGPAREALGREVEGEAVARGVDPTDPQAFMTLGTVARIARELQGPEAAAEAALHDYGALVFHAFRFQEAGFPLFLLTAAASRRLVEGTPDAEPAAPAPAGYLQLPQHLFWTPGAGEAPPESVDGMFWSVSRRGLLHALGVGGVRADRPGFSAVPLPEAPLSEAAGWLHAEGREGGSDYRSTLPGRELDRLYSVETAGELLKLLARFFAYVRAVPHASEEPRQVPAETGGAGAGPHPSALPYRRVTLVA